MLKSRVDLDPAEARELKSGRERAVGDARAVAHRERPPVGQSRVQYPQCLGEHDQSRRLPPGEPERTRGVHAPRWNHLQSATNRLGQVGTSENGDARLREQQLVDFHACRECERHDEHGEVQHGNEWHASNNFDDRRRR